MTQAPYSWQLTGSCPACGSPIYGRLLKPGRSRANEQEWLSEEQPEARRTCPASCPHGKASELQQRIAELNRDK